MTYIRWLSAQIAPITKITKNEYRYSNEMCLRLRSGTRGFDFAQAPVPVVERSRNHR